MATEQKEQVFDIPKECKAGVVVNEGPDFRVEVQMVPVPEISMRFILLATHLFVQHSSSLCLEPRTIYMAGGKV